MHSERNGEGGHQSWEEQTDIKEVVKSDDETNYWHFKYPDSIYKLGEGKWRIVKADYHVSSKNESHLTR